MGRRKRTKAYHQEREAREKYAQIQHAKLMNTPQQLFTIIFPLGAKKGDIGYQEVPMWKPILFSLGLFLAIGLFVKLQKLEGYDQFYAMLAVCTLGLIACIICLLKIKDTKSQSAIIIIGVICFVGMISYALDIPHLSNPMEIHLMNSSVKRSQAGGKGIITSYKLSGYTSDGHRVTFDLTERQRNRIPSDPIIRYLPNSKIIIDIEKMSN